jgi:FkbM family methyltransferase
LTLVQIGANVGNTLTGSDPIFKFLERHCGPGRPAAAPIRAVLLEPVAYLHRKLLANYAGFRGVTCLNVAIAERAGTKPFYRLREGINLAAHGLPPYAEELGSFLRQNLKSLWDHDPGNQALRDFAEANIVEELVPCLTLEQVLARERLAAVDLLLVDTEGYDYEILRSLNFARLAPRHINYEQIHRRRDEAACRRLLLEQGYRLHDHGQDTFCT